MPKHAKVITIADTKGGSTKSTTAVNIAAFSACSGLRTLLLDFDLEQPTACSYFPLQNEAPCGASKNFTPAMVFLGHHFSEKNAGKSLNYFEQACRLHSSDGCTNASLQQKKYQLSLLLKKLTNDQHNPAIITEIAQWYEAEKQYSTAIDYYLTIVDNDPKLWLKISELYSKTDIDEYRQHNMIVQSYVKYLQYFDDAEIKYKLHDLYSPREEEWLYWLEQAAESDHVRAKYDIADEYYNGFHIPQDYSKALYWYNRACTEKDDDFKYAYCEAFYLINEKPGLQENADNGDMEAQYQLALIISHYDKFYEIGQSYFDKAEAQGHVEASIMKHAFIKSFAFE